MNFDTIRERLLSLDTACVSDANKDLRVMDPGIRSVRLGLKLVGKAHTILCKEDFLTVIKGLHDAQPGQVLVIDTRGSRRAVAGELFSREALRRGLAGIVIDGAVRDTEKIRGLSIPVYSRSVTPVSGTTRRIFETQVAVQCGGVTVDPGDVLFGDDDGIVVATEKELAEVIPIAETIQQKEEAAIARMEQGDSLLTLINFEEHYRAVQANRESQLTFA
jgi:4-hydroxy-4-methyl-2-oxoglutarate aldolase